MFKSIARRVLGTKLKALFHDYYQNAFREGRVLQENSISRVKLGKQNILNCRLLLDRQSLLEQMPKNAVVAEIGVDQGEFTQQIIDQTSPSCLHLVDVWSSDRYDPELEYVVRRRFQSQLDAGVIRIHKNLSTNAVTDFPNAYFDWIYLDSYHSYEVTRDELLLYSPKMKPGGIIAGHDYEMGDWVNSLRFGVIEAVHEFCRNEGWELIFITAEPIEYRSFAIRKIS
jgi:hypothetical protein